ncbi:WbuC family cupin fold metalloprotein [Fastidiosibacter lacustris]|uniref:WbuC family cupin fold metalloprotein n=1 Tax=Fastidiosibacter lacustris TaxID=2056695 RepID=UPI000E341EFC|nr:WbuC family cupin fold metalloprotein [Fastidiosibacter lacustris]
MKKLNNTLIQKMLMDAHASPRLRSHHNLHSELSDPVNRLCIALTKGTYIRPHRHSESHKWELILALKGQTAVVIYDDKGVIIDKFIIAPNTDMMGFEIPSNTWHSFYALSDESVFFEVKPGPFEPTPETDFANWAPKESEVHTIDFLAWQFIAGLGEKYRAKP